MKKILKILFLIMLIISVCQISTIYALYKSKLQGNYEYVIGDWKIRVNNVLISQDGTTNLNITPDNVDYFSFESSTLKNNVEDGKVVPGMSGYVTYRIDPTGTDVSVLYEIDINIDEMETYTGETMDDTLNEPKIRVASIERHYEKNGVTLEDEGGSFNSKQTDNEVTGNTVFKGVINIDKIQGMYTEVVKIKLAWVDENDTDLGVGENYDMNFKIPVKMIFKQYTGETL